MLLRARHSLRAVVPWLRRPRALILQLNLIHNVLAVLLGGIARAWVPLL